MAVVGTITVVDAAKSAIEMKLEADYGMRQEKEKGDRQFGATTEPQKPIKSSNEGGKPNKNPEHPLTWEAQFSGFAKIQQVIASESDLESVKDAYNELQLEYYLRLIHGKDYKPKKAPTNVAPGAA